MGCCKDLEFCTSADHFYSVHLRSASLCNHRLAFSIWCEYGHDHPGVVMMQDSRREVNSNSKTHVMSLDHLYLKCMSIHEPVIEVKGMELIQ